MLIVETIRKTRCAYHRDRKAIRQIAREFNLSKDTVKKVIRGDVTECTYARKEQLHPKLGRIRSFCPVVLLQTAQSPGDSSGQPWCCLRNCNVKGLKAAMTASGAMCRNGAEAKRVR
jgi:hypothetical protein